MAGISARAVYNPVNKNQLFQGQPLDDELGLNWYGFKYRNHDPQIGRFIEVDPLASDYTHNSPYAFSENHVTAHVELEGLEKSPINAQSNPLAYITEGFRQYFQATTSILPSFDFDLGGSTSTITTLEGPGFEASQAVPTSELKFSVQSDFSGFFATKGSAPAFSMSLTNTTNPSATEYEAMASTDILSPIPVSAFASTKLSMDGNGTNLTNSIGLKLGVSIPGTGLALEGSESIFHSNQLSGSGAGQQSIGYKISAEASYTTKPIEVINPSGFRLSTATEYKIGTNFSSRINFKW